MRGFLECKSVNVDVDGWSRWREVGLDGVCPDFKDRIEAFGACTKRLGTEGSVWSIGGAVIRRKEGLILLKIGYVWRFPWLGDSDWMHRWSRWC